MLGRVAPTVREGGLSMDYKELVDKLRNNNIDNNCHDCALGYYAFHAATAITDLLARAEAAEKKATELDKALSDAAKVVRTMQERTIPYYRNRAETAEKEVEWKNKVIEAAERRFVEAEARAKKAERERDAAIKWIREFTEFIDRPCVACRHDTGDYVALGVCGGCSKDKSKWEWKGKGE